MRFLVFLFISAKLFSQDTIVFRSKEVKAVKVFEIGINEIKYHSFDNLEGPMYITEKSEIHYIKYPNGKIDTFKVAAAKVEAPVIVNNGPAYPFEKIQIHRKKLSYEDRGLSETKMLKLILDYPFPQTKSVMMKEYNKVKVYKNNRRFGLGVVGAGIICWMALLSTPSTTNVGALFLGANAFCIGGSIVGRINKNKVANKKVEIARMYNEWK